MGGPNAFQSGAAPGTPGISWPGGAAGGWGFLIQAEFRPRAGGGAAKTFRNSALGPAREAEQEIAGRRAWKGGFVFPVVNRTAPPTGHQERVLCPRQRLRRPQRWCGEAADTFAAKPQAQFGAASGCKEYICLRSAGAASPGSGGKSRTIDGSGMYRRNGR